MVHSMVSTPIKACPSQIESWARCSAVLDAFEFSHLCAVIDSPHLVQDNLYDLHDVASTAGGDAGCACSSLDWSDRL